MSKAKALVDRIITEMESGHTYDWRQVRKEIHDAHDVAKTEADRILCLGVHKIVMDTVERQGLIEDDKLADFRKARQQDYNLLLVKEAMIGRTDGNVAPDKMAAITRREVAAGRMSPVDELHRLSSTHDPTSSPPRRKTRPMGAWSFRPLRKIAENAISAIFLISIVWLFALTIGDARWTAGIGIAGTVVCLLLPRGRVVIRWLCSSKFRQDWAVMHGDTIRKPRKDFERFLNGALATVNELQDISKHARDRLLMHERIMEESDVVELIHMLGAAHKRIEEEMASNAAKVTEAAETELDWETVDILLMPTIQMTKSPKAIIDLMVDSANKGARSAKIVYELAVAEIDATVARYYTTLNTSLNKEDSAAAIWNCMPMVGNPRAFAHLRQPEQ
jgi:hypothetical protein